MHLDNNTIARRSYLLYFHGTEPSDGVADVSFPKLRHLRQSPLTSSKSVL